MEKPSDKWTDEEVRALLAIYSTEEVQRGFEGSQRNIKIFATISAQLETGGIYHTAKQCREKMKKLKQDYKKIKDHNNQSGANRKTSKWFDTLDMILGHRPAYSGNAGTKDSCAGLLEAIVRGESTAPSQELEETELNGILDVPAATSTPRRYQPATTSEPSAAATISHHQPAASILCVPTPATTPEPSAASTSSQQQPAASILCHSRPGKRKRTDTLLASVQEMLASDAEQQRQSDARLNNMLQFFQEQAEREAEEHAALRAELAEANRQQKTLMEGLFGLMTRMEERQETPK